ncbi:MAG: pyridoxamine kinase [Clostridia bacterium]|nr:pyridoxamine kinase [Clostridia bacterium]
MNVTKNTIRPPKRVLVIQDLSCFGRCATTVVSPVLSAMGVQVIPVPTALLSTHTGGFTDLYFKDLSEDMERISDHFERLGLKFDAIYTGFLGSERQIDIVLDFIKKFSNEDTIIFVDPVMGDDGVLYSTYDDMLCRRMRELCSVADMITPNLTEACFLSDTPYTDTSAMSEAEAKAFADSLCEKLSAITSGKMVITGIEHSDNMLGTYGNTKDGSDEAGIYSVRRVSRSYPGTGDLFASVLLGSLLRGDAECEAIRFASDYIRRVMEYSSQIDTPEREGVAFECFMVELCERGR